MLPGPVFEAELRTTARRARYYAARLGYGLILLMILWQSFAAWLGPTTALPPNEMTRLARAVFAAIGVFQLAAVLVMTPALVAGVIADEKQRRTLHYLMSSRLSSAEVVLGKLAARLLHIGVFLGVALPVVSLLTLLGGVDPRLVLAAYGLTGSTAFFVASLSVLVSTVARKVREAISVAYLLTLAWLVMPSLARVTLRFQAPRLFEWVAPILDWVEPSSPLVLLNSGRIFTAGPSALVPAAAWMFGLQVTYGAAMVLLAIVALRPIFRSEASRAEGVSRLERLGRLRLWAHPGIGDRPMLWKELYTSRTKGLARLVAVLLGLVVVGVLGYEAFDLGGAAFVEVWRQGYGTRGPTFARLEFSRFLRAVTAGTYVLMALAVATTAAASVTGEREEDTWTSLVATPLDGREIVLRSSSGRSTGCGSSSSGC